MPNLPVNIPPFSGEDDENIVDWFENFEVVARTYGWTMDQMFRAVPTYLLGTARRWFNFVTGNYTPEVKRPASYVGLKESMIRDLCPSDYRSYLSQQLNSASQRPGQSTTSFIYEIQELCLRIDESIY